MKAALVSTVILVCLWPFPDAAADEEKEIGEFSIPAVHPLDRAAIERLRELARTDSEAKALAEKSENEARPLLGAEPNPLEVIHYEGLVNTDPRRIADVENLEDMAHAARLTRYWQLTGNERAAETLRRFIAAWTETYEITGNDVNENKFYPLLVAYEALRDTFDTAERHRTDAWVERLGERHAKAVKDSEHLTNRYTKSVRLLAIAGRILDREAWVTTAHDGVRRFVRTSLYADGTSRDLKHRDSLTYHGSGLKSVIDLAMISGDEGRALYTWTSPKGGSIKKSVDYVVPYAMGEKTHKEWVHSKVGLDRRRARAGLEKYRPGRLYEPKQATELMEKASHFDPSLRRVALHLLESDAERFPTWQMLVNEAARERQGDEGW